MKLKLPDSVASPQDLTALILEVHEYTRWFGHEAIKKQTDAKHHSEPPALSPATIKFIYEWRAKKTLTQQSLDELATLLERHSHTAPSITLTLAAPPTSHIKTTLVAWCRENIDANILVNFQFNATLLGGIVVRYGSRVFDWSFRRQLLAARERFPEVLRRV